MRLQLYINDVLIADKDNLHHKKKHFINTFFVKSLFDRQIKLLEHKLSIYMSFYRKKIRGSEKREGRVWRNNKKGEGH